jgi:two-component system nitrate/nitrite response regulator NarL
VSRHRLLTEGLRHILNKTAFAVVAGAVAVEDLQGVPEAPLLVLDVSGEPQAVLAQVTLFHKLYPEGRLVLLADHDQLSDADVVAAFRAGAHAYLLKPSCAAFLKSLELVVLGESILPPSVLPYLLDQVQPPVDLNGFRPQLSMREISILRRLVEGQANKVIARELAIAEATVKVHVKAVFRKIGVRNRTQAAMWASKNEMLILPPNGRALESPHQPIAITIPKDLVS